MQILMMIFAVFFAMGLFFILADLLKIPSLAVEKAMLSAVKANSQKTKNIEVLLNKFAVRIAKYLPIDEYKKIRMRNTLNAAGMKETPEEFMANALVKSGVILLGVIPALILFPLLAPVVLILAVIVYFKEIRKADEKLNAKREKIEIELPRFVATITQELKASRDVLSILENFKKNAGADFAKELDIVTADMRH